MEALLGGAVGVDQRGTADVTVGGRVGHIDGLPIDVEDRRPGLHQGGVGLLMRMLADKGWGIL